MLPLMFHSVSAMMHVLKNPPPLGANTLTKRAHPLTVLDVAVRCLQVQKTHHTWLTCVTGKSLHNCAPSVLRSNKTPPYGWLWVRPCKSSMAASHYYPIKAVGAMELHVIPNSSSVCCTSSRHVVTW